MPNFILTRRAVILCPHGGIVTHIPRTFTDYRVNGEWVMLMNDQYVIAGCPGTGMGNNCMSIIWTNASPFLLIKGSPALTNASVGLCQTVEGGANGPAIITQFQTEFPEPDTVTIINS